MKRIVDGKTHCLSGVITPFEWKNNGRLMAISLSTDRGRYVIASNERGQELFDFIDESVQVVGEVVHDQKGQRVIIVSNYTFLDEDPISRKDHE